MVRMSRCSRSAIWSRCRSTSSFVDDAAAAGRRIPACVRRSIPAAPAAPMVMLTWAAGSAAAGPLRHGPLCRFQPARSSRTRTGPYPQNHGPDHADGHFADQASMAPWTAGVKPGSTVYVAGAGPVGLAAAASTAQLLGAAVIMIGDARRGAAGLSTRGIKRRLRPDRSHQTADTPRRADRRHGRRRTDDRFGHRCRRFRSQVRHGGGDQPAIVLNQAMEIIEACWRDRHTGIRMSTEDARRARQGRQNRQPQSSPGPWLVSSRTPPHRPRRPSCATTASSRMALLNDRLPIAKIVNAKAISLEDAPRRGTPNSSIKGVAAKFAVLDPHGMRKAKAA